MTDSPLCAIVGMGPGIGRGVARRFAKEGFAIGMISRDPEALRRFEAEIPNSRGVVADAGDERALRAALRELGPAAVLVYNASAGHSRPAPPLDAEAAIADFRVNLLGAVAAVQESVSAMRAAGRGTIFITGGGLALKPMAS